MRERAAARRSEVAAATGNRDRSATPLGLPLARRFTTLTPAALPPNKRCAADTAGALLTWARSRPQTAVASVRAHVLSTTPWRRLAVCFAPLLLTAGSLSTPASGAANARRSAAA
jgi:hypothetical protein